MGNQIDKLLTVLDADKSGSVSPHEVREWIRDEQWNANPEFEKADTKEKLRNLLKELDKEYPEKETKEYQQISKDKLTAFFESFEEGTRAKLCESLVAEESKRRGPLIERIFTAMDTSGDGKVSAAELTSWIKFEGVFQASHQFDEKKINDKISKVLAQVSKTAGDQKDAMISLQDLTSYFSGWTLREVRRVTEDLVKHSRKRDIQVQRIVDALDSDRSGSISGHELREWLNDEHFRSNKRLIAILSKLKGKMAEQSDKKDEGTPPKGDEQVPAEQLKWFLNSLRDSTSDAKDKNTCDDFDYLVKYVLTDSPVLKTDLIKEAFAAMDSSKNGEVSIAEVEEWVKHEGIFQERHGGDSKRVSQKLNQIWKSMGGAGKTKITQAEFGNYFEKCTLREMRMMTNDLLHRARSGKKDESKAEAKAEVKLEEKKA